MVAPKTVRFFIDWKTLSSVFCHQHQHISDGFVQILAVDDQIEESAFQYKFGRLEAFWKVFFNGFFDYPRPSEAYQCARLSDIYITKH